MKQEKTSLLRRAFLDTLPVLTGYIVLGIGFGLILHTKGYGVWWALAMSVFVFAGSMQFAAIPLMVSGAGLLTTALTTLAVNARHLFYGLSMVDRYKGSGKKKPFLIFWLTDETYSLVCRDDTEEKTENKQLYYLLVSGLDYLYWITGSVLGSLAGSLIHFDTTGLDFALTALFVTVFVEQWLSTKDHLPALIGVGVSVLCLLIFGSDSFLIPAMVLIAALLTMIRKKEEGRV